MEDPHDPSCNKESADVNRRVGTFYAAGAALLFGASVITRPAGLALLWPAAALLLVSLGYYGLGPAIYGKRNGRHPPWSRCLYFFVLAGHEISRRHYARRCREWDEVIPGLLIGRHLRAREAEKLVQQGVTAVLDLTSEFSECARLRKLPYLNLPLLDLTAPSGPELAAAGEFISRHMQSGKVYVHCKIGYSRTAAVTGAYLVRYGYAENPAEAIALLRRARPSIVIRPEALRTIESTTAG
jgi:protein phosphatase